jgi:hypothetical protein
MEPVGCMRLNLLSSKERLEGLSYNMKNIEILARLSMGNLVFRRVHLYIAER